MTENEKKSIILLFRIALKSKNKIVLITFCLLAGMLISVFIPILNQQIVDTGIMSGNFYYTVQVVSLVFFLTFIKFIFENVKEYIRTSLAAEMKKSLFTTSFKSYMRVKTSYFYDKNPSEILNSAFFDIDNITNVCSNELLLISTHILNFLGAFIGLYLISPMLSLVAFAYIPIKLLVTFSLAKIKKKLFSSFMETVNSFAHWFGDCIDGVKEIRIFCIEQYKIKESQELVHDFTCFEKKLSRLDAFNMSFDSLLINFIVSLLYIYGSHLIFLNSISIGSLFAFIAFSFQALAPVSSAINANYALKGVLPSFERYYLLLNDIDSNSEQCGKILIESIDSIEFKNVTYSYGDMNVLNNVSFILTSGQKIALIGRNGSGKSTIFNLICKFIDPTKGDIFVNNFNINDIDTNSLRNALSVINQVNYIFNACVKDNIELYNSMPDGTFRSILTTCRLDDVYNNFENLTLGNNGSRLSGGQKQKIAFARIIVKNNQWYLLDEATSNLDNESEVALISEIMQQSSKQTIVMIAHDLELIKDFDIIIRINSNASVTVFTSIEDFFNSHRYKHEQK